MQNLKVKFITRIGISSLFIVSSIFLSLLVAACGDDSARVNLIDYKKPSDVTLTPGKIEGVWNGDFETGDHIQKAIDLGEPVYTKIGMRITQGRLEIQMRCSYYHANDAANSDENRAAVATSDAFASVPALVDPHNGTITVTGSAILRASPEQASNPCQFSLIKGQSSSYVIDGTSITIKGQFGVHLEKRGDQ